MDRDARFPREALAALRGAKFLSAAVPAAYGGAGLDIVQVGKICEALGHDCASSAMIYAMHMIQVACIARHAGQSAYFQDYLRTLVEEQRLIASATTELGVGGDLRSSICAAEVTGETFRLTKQAPVISYGEDADEILVTCRSGPAAQASDQVQLLVRREDCRWGNLSAWDILGFRGTCSSGFTLTAAGKTAQIIPAPFAGNSRGDHAPALPRRVVFALGRHRRRRGEREPQDARLRAAGVAGRRDNGVGNVMKQLLPLDPARHERHGIHARDRDWTETNCYVDAWVELLHAWGFDPVAALPFTLAIDFDADQWTFFKYPLADLFDMYGLAVQELALWRPLAAHLEEHVGNGRPVLVEVDSYYLPDTAGMAYRIEHVKSTIGVNEIDVENRRLGYFHGQGYFHVCGDDYVNLLHLRGGDNPAMLPPYAEVVKRRRVPPLAGGELTEASVRSLRRQLTLLPDSNPFRRFKARLGADLAPLDEMAARWQAAADDLTATFA